MKLNKTVSSSDPESAEALFTALKSVIAEMNIAEQWFQEVVEPEPNQPEFPVEEIKALTSMYKDMIAHIRQQKYTEADLDKARREGVSNGETMYSLEDVRKALHGEWGTGNAVENVLNRLRNYKK